MTPIELLSPAKDIAHGKAAIVHGADAVYIGAPHFSARHEASNSITDIEQLVRFAHLYRTKVYVALNTILYDNEIEDALHLIRQLYEIGIDALIIQDMGLLQCDLPPIPLFASTQTHNHSPEKITFLEKVGFQRVILARELSLSDIKEIRHQTKVALECFVHGALCVSYSGQCYMSQAIIQRSGNRGVCAQPCRLAYRLLDANGNILANQAHLLSLKDLNLSGYLSELMKAGITSFKIEGRLKDVSYVKNITAYYRQLLDNILERDGHGRKASSGKVTTHFIPNPYKTFNRGYTSYFVDGRKEKVASPQTQKSIGERLGKVTKVSPPWFAIDTQTPISHGDGLCWLHPDKGLEGALVNRTEGKKVFPAKPVQLTVGTEIYRNNDILFEKQLAGNSADRRITVSFELHEQETGYALSAKDEDGNSTEYAAKTPKIVAKDAAKAREQIIAQLCKLGNSIFVSDEIILPDSFGYFIPTAEINDMRRQVMQQLETCRLNHYQATPVHLNSSNVVSFPTTALDHRGNVANRHAQAFYRQYGVDSMEDAFELQENPKGKILMTTKHCIKYQYDMCPVKQHPKQKWNDPLFIQDNRHIYRLEFDCRACEMNISLEK